MYIKENFKGHEDQYLITDNSAVITCCFCEFRFVAGKTHIGVYCPNCGKKLGKEVKLVPYFGAASG